MKQAVVLLMVGMLLSPSYSVAQQGEAREPVSRSVVRSTSNVFAEVLGNLHTNNRQPGDWARAEIAYRVLFEHMERTGTNEAMDLAIRLHRGELASMKLTEVMVKSLPEGITESELRKSVALLPKLVEEFESAGGMKGLQARILVTVHAKAEREAAYLAGAKSLHVRCCGPSCAATEAEGGLLAAGFGVAALFGCVPCAAIGAGLLFGAALVQYLCV